ncbi:hypothetical protein MBORA_09840 [Methanobrevibacter oralis]|uniref:N-acetyltransferase domain-containing protein n=1 Tax=Methanobrevibacter oralis TaxID=66851 RepID=A0A166B6P9_METOA|nr:GNAT family N-acetyltransferase [Methanobrevibacter oralis]KZX12941.1 hypothetical protein MBORA_09840 [Methanobrevibacter oralis]
MNYLKRDDNTQRIFLTESALNVEDILKEKYDYIWDAINDENFILKSPECNLFKELLYDNKVVGFCSYDFSRQFMTVALNNIYILPNFRRKGIFYRELKKIIETHQKPSIVEPTHLIVEILIKYGFAQKINDNIVVSAIEFVIPGHNVITDCDYNDSEELSTHFYDLNMSASIHFLDLKNASIAYSSPLNYDIIHYNALENRAKIDEDYIKEIQKYFIENEEEILNLVQELEEGLPLKKYTLDEIIGEDDELSFYMETLLDDAHTNYAKLLKIKEQIRNEYEEEKLLDESLLIRLEYLLNDNKTPTITSHSETCPYCNMPTDNHDRFCHFCGLKLI